jgi:amino acid transporter
MTESFAAIAFYIGLAALVFGSMRLVRAALERHRRDRVGIVALAIAGVCFLIAVALFSSGPRGVIPF